MDAREARGNAAGSGGGQDALDSTALSRLRGGGASDVADASQDGQILRCQI